MNCGAPARDTGPDADVADRMENWNSSNPHPPGHLTVYLTISGDTGTEESQVKLYE